MIFFICLIKNEKIFKVSYDLKNMNFTEENTLDENIKKVYYRFLLDNNKGKCVFEDTLYKIDDKVYIQEYITFVLNDNSSVSALFTFDGDVVFSGESKKYYKVSNCSGKLLKYGGYFTIKVFNSGKKLVTFKLKNNIFYF